MWAVVAVVAATVGVSRLVSGQSWGNYLWITLFTGGLAVFMYFFKKRNREYMETYYKSKEKQKQ